jgi:hypothetical protein
MLDKAVLYDILLTKNHSLYWSFQTAFQPSGTLGGGGPYATSAAYSAYSELATMVTYCWRRKVSHDL